MAQHPHHLEVLATGEVGIDRGELTRHTDATTHGVGLLHHVATEHLGSPGVGLQHGGQHPHGGGLAGAVGAEQAEHGSLGHLEIYPVEGDDIAEPFLESLHDDRVLTHAGEAPTYT